MKIKRQKTTDLIGLTKIKKVHEGSESESHRGAGDELAGGGGAEERTDAAGATASDDAGLYKKNTSKRIHFEKKKFLKRFKS